MNSQFTFDGDSLSVFSGVKKLRIYCCYMNSLECLYNLEELVIDNMPNLSNINIESKFPDLRLLVLLGCKIITFEGLENLPNLKELHITYYRGMENTIKKILEVGYIHLTLHYIRGVNNFCYDINPYKINQPHINDRFFITTFRRRKSEIEITKTYIMRKVNILWHILIDFELI